MKHPAVRIELHLSDRNLDLVGEGLDMAVRIGALPDSGRGSEPGHTVKLGWRHRDG